MTRLLRTMSLAEVCPQESTATEVFPARAFDEKRALTMAVGSGTTATKN